MQNHLHAGAWALASLFLIPAAHAHGVKTPQQYAPIGVMGDHLHMKGHWMAAYRFDRAVMTGLRSGNDTVGDASVMAVYGEAPIKMEMVMHMFEFMYGLTDQLTLMVMPHYMEMGMMHRSSHGGGHTHTHQIEGFGDTEVTGFYSLWHNAESRAHLNLGVSLPTGATDKTFTDHHNNVYPMPYNMQLGSGTFDPILGGTYVSERQDWSWGAQTIHYIRLGENNNGWRQGNKYTATAWAARNLAPYASLSLRIKGEAWGNVHGRDKNLPLLSIAGAVPGEQAGERVTAHIGANLLAGEGHRLGVEFGIPLYERYAGPQPDSDWRFTLGWQGIF